LRFVFDLFRVPLLWVSLEVELHEEDEEEEHVPDGEDRVDEGEPARVVEEQDQAVPHHSQELNHLKLKM